MFLFRRVFWGFLILALGILILLENIYGLDLPIWGIFWSVVIIAIGLSLLLPSEDHDRWWQEHRKSGQSGDVIFDEGKIEADGNKRDYNIIFGKGTVDLTKIKLGEKNKVFEINAVFGGGEVLIDENIPMKIKATGAFGGTRLPDGNTAAFGDRYYTTKAYDQDKPAAVVHINSVFGGLDIIEKK